MAMTLRLTEKLDAELDALASAQGISKQQLIVSAIEDYLERNFH
jgi:predicted transcriptional regulator